jgi:hypothetical protein
LQKPEFAKTALLLWDKVDYISPAVYRPSANFHPEFIAACFTRR